MRLSVPTWLTALLALNASVFAASEAAGQSLQEIRAQEAEERALAEEARYTNSVCEISLQTSIDWRSAANWPDSVSLSGTCDGALGAIEAVCKTAAGRTRAKRLTRFVCAGDGAGPPLRGGALRFGAQPGVNGFNQTKAYLDQNL